MLTIVDWKKNAMQKLKDSESQMHDGARPVNWVKNNTRCSSNFLNKFKLLRGVNCIAQTFGLWKEKNQRQKDNYYMF